MSISDLKLYLHDYFQRKDTHEDPTVLRTRLRCSLEALDSPIRGLDAPITEETSPIYRELFTLINSHPSTPIQKKQAEKDAFALIQRASPLAANYQFRGAKLLTGQPAQYSVPPHCTLKGRIAWKQISKPQHRDMHTFLEQEIRQVRKVQAKDLLHFMHAFRLDATQTLQKLAPHLQELDLSDLQTNTPHSQNILHALAEVPLPELRALNLRGTPVTNTSLAFVAQNSSNLNTLDCMYCKALTNREGLSSLALLKQLRHLNLTGTAVRDNTFTSIVKNNLALQELHLSNCFKLTDRGLAALPVLHMLRSISLGDSFITDKTLSELIQHNPDLENIDLSDCEDLSEPALLHLSHLRNLRELNLSGMRVSNKTLGAIIKNKPPLHTLILSSCYSICDAGIAKLAQLGTLRVLKLNALGLADKYLLPVIRANPHLEEVSFSTLRGPTNKGWGYLAHLRELKFLDLGGTIVSDKTIADIVRMNPRLVEISLLECPKITREGLIALSQAHPSIEIVSELLEEAAPI